MCLRNIFTNFTANNMKKARLNGYTYDFLMIIVLLILLLLIILSVFIIFDEKTLYKMSLFKKYLLDY